MSTPTLTFGQLKEDLAALPAYSSHLPTNIIALTHVCGEVLAELDDSTEEDLKAELETAISSLEDANRQTTEAEARANKAKEENEKLLQEMAALRDPSDEGESVRSYRERTLAAEAQVEEWRKHSVNARHAVEDAERETKALRARKGIPAGVFKQIHRITALLSTISRTMGHNQAEEAAAILKEIKS